MSKKFSMAERTAYNSGLLKGAISTDVKSRSTVQKAVVKSYENGIAGVTVKTKGKGKPANMTACPKCGDTKPAIYAVCKSCHTGK